MSLRITFHDKSTLTLPVNGAVELDKLYTELYGQLVIKNRNDYGNSDSRAVVIKYDDGKRVAVISMNSVQYIETVNV